MLCPKCKATLVINGDIAGCPACNSKYRLKKKVNPPESSKAAVNPSVRTLNLSAMVCPSCGASRFSKKEYKYTCECCEREYTIDDTPPTCLVDLRVADDKRQSADFAGARQTYDRIKAANPDSDLTAVYWGLFLCDFNVIFEVDGKGECFPSFYRMANQCVYDNKNYQKAIEYAKIRAKDGGDTLLTLAQRIEEARSKYWSIAENNKPFDIFICFRNDGGESLQLATDLYNEFSAKYNVFFSERTLRVIKGNCREYEPNIYYGLYTAKVMLLICKKRSQIEGEDGKWVKNEWSRFTAINGKSGDKAIIPIFMDGFDPNNLPDELWHIQGCKQGITLVATLEEQLKLFFGKTTPLTESTSIEKLLISARFYIEDGKFENAEKICDQIDDPTCAEIWWLRFLISQKACTQDEIMGKNRFAERAIMFATEEQCAKYTKALADAEKRQASKAEEAKKAEVSRKAEEAHKKEEQRRIEQEKERKANLKYCISCLSESPKHSKLCTECGYNQFVDALESGIQPPNSVTIQGLSYFKKESGYSVTCADEFISSCSIPSKIYGIPVTSINEKGFQKCGNLSSITIPNSVSGIGSYAFDGCSSLTSISIPNSLICIGRSAFYDCSSLTSITIPNSVTSIGVNAFSGCSSLTHITIPYSVKSVGERAFYKCSSLSSITIPNSATYIGEWTFSGCSRLTSISIPNSVTRIGDWAFDRCSRLTSITYSGKKIQWKAVTKGNRWDNDTSEYTVYCMDGNIKK